MHVLHVFSRRVFFALGMAGILSLPARAADTPPPTVPVNQLMAPGALPDIVQGSKTAPITIIEYASMTCTHCAAFHKETYPTLKSQYIDTGKVQFVLREFPLDALAAAGFMVARCPGDDQKRAAIVDLLFDHQDTWAFVDKPADALFALVKQAGYSEASFDACLKNQDLFNKINTIRQVATDKFQVNATPTFFINGKRVAGEIPVEDLKKLLEAPAKG